MKNIANFCQKLIVTVSISLSLINSVNIPSYSQDLETVFSGQNIPLTLKFKDLDSSWRKVSVSGQFEMGDLIKSWTTFMDSILKTQTYNNVYYSQGKTITIGNNIYIIAYRIPLNIEPLNIENIFAGVMGNQDCETGKLPVKINSDTEVSLALLNLNSAGSFNDLTPLDINNEIAESEKKYQTAVMVCQQAKIEEMNQEGLDGVRTINNSQQVYYLENENFTKSFDDLDASLEKETDNYSYLINLDNDVAFSYATAKNKDLHSYVAGVTYIPDWAGFSITICKSDEPTAKKLPNPILKDYEFTCPKDTTQVE